MGELLRGGSYRKREAVVLRGCEKKRAGEKNEGSFSDKGWV